MGFNLMYDNERKKGKADPLFKGLAEAADGVIVINFHKYILDRNGDLIGSFGSLQTIIQASREGYRGPL